MQIYLPNRISLLRITRSIHFWLILIIFTIIVLFYSSGYNYWLVYIGGGWFPPIRQVVIWEYANHLHGVIFTIPFFYATIIYWWRGSLFIWLLSLVIIIPRVLRVSPDISSLVPNLLITVIPVLVVFLFVLQLKWREKERKEMQVRDRDRQNYMAQILHAQEEERQRIARELHDETVQDLLVIANRTQQIIDKGDQSAAANESEAEWIRDAVLRLSKDIRRISMDLRPSILDELGLIAAIRWLSERFNNENQVDTLVAVRGKIKQLKPETDAAIFRIVQEALNNIRRHSEATRVNIEILFHSANFEIKVRDNGIGLLFSQKPSSLISEKKLGILGMQQRAQLIGGQLGIHPAPDNGTVVHLKVNY
ncbi:sensor histidine kinase [Chloroflexota bacterium]